MARKKWALAGSACVVAIVVLVLWVLVGSGVPTRSAQADEVTDAAVLFYECIPANQAAHMSVQGLTENYTYAISRSPTRAQPGATEANCAAAATAEQAALAGC